ncbi:MAG TPA: MFS transporter, partial [Acetobacteraceae bacterium]|nr:MFS transporter [Acetobacteraceae bacterium]
MSQATTTLGRSSPIVAEALRRRAILSCMIGNFLEIYDFTVYGFFASFIGQTFFPSSDPLISLLTSFATFGVGFVMRPVGGLVMGAYADKFGRRSALIVTMAMMAIGTALPGLTPGYATIGAWAPLILLICRLTQGFSTG